MTDFLALNRAVFQSSLPTSERMVLLALIDHLPNCEPSVSRLTSWTGLCDRAIRLCIKSLVARGVVEVNMVNGKRSTYILHLCNLGNENRGTSYRGNENRGTTCRTPRHQLPGTPAPDADEGTKKGTKEGTPLPPAASPDVTVSKQTHPQPMPSHSEWMAQPVQVRASKILGNPHLALAYEPHRWPEVSRPIEALVEADGKSKPRLGHYAGDAAVRRVVEHLAAGYEPAELVERYRAIPTSDWWRKQTKPGASSVSSEVLRRAEPTQSKPSGYDMTIHRELTFNRSIGQ